MDVFDLSASLNLDISKYQNALASARDAGRKFESAGGGVTNATQKLSGGFTVLKGVISNVIGSGINAFAGALSGNLQSAISRTDTLNNYAIVMENLGHNATDAKAEINKLADGIDGLPTTLDSIASTQQQFTALGMSMKEATDLSLALNNATLAGGRGQAVANSAMQQWYQMIAAGKSDLMSMRIINEAMPAQMDAIAKSVIGANANWQDLHAEWQKNPEITQKVQDAILELNEKGANGIGSFAEQAEAATQGIGTSMQNLQSAIQRGMANVLNAVGQENIAGMFEGIKQGINSAFADVVSFVETVKDQGLSQGITDVIQNIGLALSTLGETIGSALNNIDWASATSDVLNHITQAFLVIPPHLAEFFGSIDWIGIVQGIGQGIANALPQMVSVISTALVDFQNWLFDNGATAIIKLGEGIINNLPAIVSAMGQIVAALMRVSYAIPIRLYTAAIDAIKQFALGILKGASRALTSAKNVASKVLSGVKVGLASLPGIAWNAIVSFANKIASGAGQAASAARGVVNNVISALRSGLSGLADVGMNIVRGIASGITNGVGYIKGVITSFVGNVKSFIKNLFGINSPSKWARDVIGSGIDEGIALGITQNAGLVDDAVDDILPTFDNIESGLTTTINGNGSALSGNTYNEINNNITVDGAKDPEAWAMTFTRQLEEEMRR